MQFSQVVGQQKVSDSLIQAAANQRLPHALLFKGDLGYGSFALGLALASYLLCQQRTATDSCGACPNCLKTQKLIHPDVHFIFPVFGSKSTSDDFLKPFRSFVENSPYGSYEAWVSALESDNKQGNISTEATKKIIQKAGLKSFSGNEKIFFIWKAEYLQKEGNRLLKLIEEPPENTYFFLFAENIQLILNTILSRCQLVHVPAIEKKAIFEKLQTMDVGTAQVEEVVAIAEGNWYKAERLAENNHTEFGADMIQFLRVCFKGRPLETMSWLEPFGKKSRDYKKQFFEYGLFFLRELNLWKMTAGRRAMQLPELERKSAEKLSELMHHENMSEIIDIFAKNAFYLERNANDKILFFNTTLKLHKLLRNKA